MRRLACRSRRGGAKPRIPAQRRRVAYRDEPHGYQTRRAGGTGSNSIAGSTRLLAHGQIFPGRQNLGFMQQQIEQFHPRLVEGLQHAYTAKLDDNPESELKQWRLDDEQVAYRASRLIRNNAGSSLPIRASSTSASTRASRLPRRDTPEQGQPDRPAEGVARLAEFNFIIYHACSAPRFFDAKRWQAIRAEKLRNGVPDLRWLTEVAQTSAPLKNVYAEIGTRSPRGVVTFPWRAHAGAAHEVHGAERIVFGSDSLWYGAPQWQIEASGASRSRRRRRKSTAIRSSPRRTSGRSSASIRRSSTSCRPALHGPAGAEGLRGAIPDRLRATLTIPDIPGPQRRGDKLSTHARGLSRGQADTRVTGATAGSGERKRLVERHLPKRAGRPRSCLPMSAAARSCMKRPETRWPAEAIGRCLEKLRLSAERPADAWSRPWATRVMALFSEPRRGGQRGSADAVAIESLRGGRRHQASGCASAFTPGR